MFDSSFAYNKVPDWTPSCNPRLHRVEVLLRQSSNHIPTAMEQGTCIIMSGHFPLLLQQLLSLTAQLPVLQARVAMQLFLVC